MIFTKRPNRTMVTTTMNQYVFLVLLMTNLNSPSASSQQIIVNNTNNRSSNGGGEGGGGELQQQSRKLTDEVEMITHSNLISEDSSVSKVAKPKIDLHAALNVDAKDYQYFNAATAVSTPKYESSSYDHPNYESAHYESLQREVNTYEAQTNYQDLSGNYELPKYGPPMPPLPPSVEIPSNYKIDESDLTHSYYTQQFEPLPYAPGDSFLGNRHAHAVPVAAAHEAVLPMSQPVTTISQIIPNHSGHPGHIMKVIHPPVWSPEVEKLENQYLETYRTIKSSVLSFYYKMQYIVNYFMSLFTFAGELSSLVEKTVFFFYCFYILLHLLHTHSAQSSVLFSIRNIIIHITASAYTVFSRALSPPLSLSISFISFVVFCCLKRS